MNPKPNAHNETVPIPRADWQPTTSHIHWYAPNVHRYKVANSLTHHVDTILVHRFYDLSSYHKVPGLGKKSEYQHQAED
jgi:hypothetical protein